MNLQSLLKSVKISEALVFAVFVLYLVLPISTPAWMSPYIESPLGLASIFCITIALFLYSHPVLAILYVFVAYTLLRRSAVIHSKAAYIQYTDTPQELIAEAQEEIVQGTPPYEEPRNVDVSGPQPITLEEQIVMEKAPVGRSESVTMMKTSFQPVLTNIGSASAV
jgi:hypothetical protein